MPNWVFNELQIEGEESAVREIKERLARPLPKFVNDGEETPFSFWNVIAPPEDKWDEYQTTHGFVDGKETGNTPYNWYNWNRKMWGCKWDVSEVSFEDDGDFLTYHFDTPWSPPAEMLLHLVEQNPNIKATLHWKEEQGFGSTLTVKNGRIKETNQFDWQCDNCDYKYKGDVSKIYNEELQEVKCPKCQPEDCPIKLVAVAGYKGDK